VTVEPVGEQGARGAFRLIELPKIQDRRGNLTFIEASRHVPFRIRRTYWIYDVPGAESRGQHAYRSNEEFFVALSGSFEVALDDGSSTSQITLNRGYVGLYVPPMLWRRLENFSTNAVCLIVASLPYDPADYLRDYDEYLALRGGGGA
jgi:mannose-6-phosphate isomerase-like protein (cupin superfamily)